MLGTTLQRIVHELRTRLELFGPLPDRAQRLDHVVCKPALAIDAADARGPASFGGPSAIFLTGEVLVQAEAVANIVPLKLLHMIDLTYILY